MIELPMIFLYVVISCGIQSQAFVVPPRHGLIVGLVTVNSADNSRIIRLDASVARKSQYQRDAFFDDNEDEDGAIPDPGWPRNSLRSESRKKVSKERRNDSPKRYNEKYHNGRSVRDSNNGVQNRGARIGQQRILSPLPLEEDAITDTNAHFFSRKSLNDPSFQSNKGQEMHQTLCHGAGITRPSRIQALAWPQIQTGKHVIIGEQTGSGKTLAYLLPLLQRALQTQTIGRNGAPKVLILAPTAELADQVHAVCTKIAETVPFQTMVVTANGKFTTTIRDQIRMIQRQPIDVLISTPGRISTILRTRNSGLDLSNLQAIVLDEVDILMIDETFGPQLRTVGAAAPVLDKTQFIFVTATLPDSIIETIENEFPGVVQVKGPGLHRLAPSLKENLVDVSVPADQNRNDELCFDVKAKQLLKALRQNRCRRTLVFCNTVESCRSVENLLNRKDRRGRVFEVLAFHNAMTPEARNNNLQGFAKGRRGSGKDGNENVDYILICTDRAARGVDFDSSPIDHVVIFDFPKDPAEYLRRVGRTARAGRTGTSTVFAYGWQLPIARSVMGKKLESLTVAASDMKDNEEDYEFRRNRRTKKLKDALIKEKIENGSLWE